MANSYAFQEFSALLEMADELLTLEGTYASPPKQNEQKASNGLRGGNAVLVVAAFETYLKKVFQEQINELSILHLDIDATRLPDEIWVHNVFETLTRAMKGTRLHPLNGPRADRIAGINRACGLVQYGTLDPEVFSDTQSNPNSKTVLAMFKSVGITDIFSTVKPSFDRKWKKPTASTFLPDKLDEIVGRRHRVAHTANALDIGRRDLAEGLRFLKCLALVMDAELDRHIRNLIKTCPKKT